MEDLENCSFGELKSKLELRFGEGQLSQNCYTQFTNRKQKFSQFTNRKQKFWEDYATFGSELERLARLAYPECSYAVRDKIACAQFVSSLLDGFVRRTLQLEGISSLKLAVERGKAVKIIQGENFERKKDYERRFEKGKGDALTHERKSKEEENGKQKGTKECWLCGKAGHYRADCPEKEENPIGIKILFLSLLLSYCFSQFLAFSCYFMLQERESSERKRNLTRVVRWRSYNENSQDCLVHGFSAVVFPWAGGRMPRQGLGESFRTTGPRRLPWSRFLRAWPALWKESIGSACPVDWGLFGTMLGNREQQLKESRISFEISGSPRWSSSPLLTVGPQS
ncbi:hypothetical protein EAG_04002 [Camponotus floridanus]|uniref:CCHC-type domain-containing protein n=1 Tax=Camponotus floridanus TaxID=104421 RepID=E2A074_CAMFO|nr:hypothetical protein EAG_04002 [Camponotus floridanus]